jgi:hypothetical protein
VLVVVSLLSMTIVFVGGRYNAADALAGFIVVVFARLCRSGLGPSAVPSGTTVDPRQMIFAHFLLGVMSAVGVAVIVLGVVNEPAWPGSPLLHTGTDLRRADFAVTVVAAAGGVLAALRARRPAATG